MIDLRDYFDRVYVINMNGSEDRMRGFLQRAAEAGITGFSRYPAVNGNICKPPAWWRVHHGAWGCLMSHLRIVQDVMMAGCKNYLVFEDDAVFSDDFAERLPQLVEEVNNIKGGWDMFYLGGQHLTHKGTPFEVSDTMFKCVNVNRTHAMAVNSRFFLKFSQHIIHAPDYIEEAAKKHNMHVDHQLGQIHPYIKVFAPQRWLCGQAAGASQIENKTNEELWWNIKPEPKIK